MQYRLFHIQLPLHPGWEAIEPLRASVLACAKAIFPQPTVAAAIARATLDELAGVEALEVMEAHDHKVDIVVSDVVMPEMDGPTLLKELRKRNPDLKIIFVSGYPHEAFETSLDKNEQFAFLPKPFSLPQLAAKVKEQLGR